MKMNLLSNIFKKKSQKNSHALLENQECLVDSGEKRTIIVPPNKQKPQKSPRGERRRDNAGEELSDDEPTPTIICVTGYKGLQKNDRKWLGVCSISEEMAIDNFLTVITVLNFLRRKDMIYYKYVDQVENIPHLKSDVPSVVVSSVNSGPQTVEGNNSKEVSNLNCSPSLSTPNHSPTLASVSSEFFDSENMGGSLRPNHLSLTDNENSGQLGGIIHTNSDAISGDHSVPTFYADRDLHSAIIGPKKKRIDANRVFIQPGVYFKFPEEEERALDKLLNEGNPKENYKNLDFEAKGGFGSVFAAKNKNIHSAFDKITVALKKMPHKTGKQKRMNLNEIGFMKYCKHPNIIEFLCSYQKGDELWMIMEFMEGGTLREAVTNFNFCERRIAYISREILKGIAYLHSNGLCHRDLKSSNVMISMNGEIKIIDFGLAIDFSHEKEDIHMCGSPFWMPPEQILGKPHTFSVDIWSFGVCVAEMLKGKVPHHSSRLKAMVYIAVEGLVFTKKDFPDWSDEVLDFLSKCLQMDPTKRSTAQELLEHPFLNKACSLNEIKEIIPALFMSHTLARQGLF